MNLEQCEVISLRVIEASGSLKAMATIRLAGSILIRNCIIYQGQKALLVRLPRQVNRDGRWIEIVEVVNDNLRRHLEECVKGAYLEHEKTARV